MSELKLNKDNFDAEVLKSSQPVLVDFWASWCGPCRMLGPVISELAEELKGKAKVGKVNVDEEPELSNTYGVSSIPTVLLFKDGKVVKTSIGVKPKEQFISMID